MNEFPWPMALSVIVGLIAYKFLLKIFNATAYILTEHLTTSIEIEAHYGSGSNATKWLKHMIEANSGAKLGHLRITYDIKDSKSKRRGFQSASSNDLNKKDKKEDDDDSFDLRQCMDPLPATRAVFFFYKNTLIRVTRCINKDFCSLSMTTETFSITAYGTRNKQLLIDLMKDGRKIQQKIPTKHITYFQTDHKTSHSSWRLGHSFQPRTLASIALKEGVTDEIQKDIQDFLDSREWYKERAIPYRRGYILYGPPGCGKTSFIKAIAGQIGYNIYEMQLSKLKDDSLQLLMSSIGKKAILLFEDVDAVFAPRCQDEERSGDNDALLGKLNIREAKNCISFSGLLNAIDGVASKEDYIIFMTTNRIEKLDSALIRPGRIDMRQLIDYPDEQQIYDFFKIFYPTCNDDVAKQFAKAVVKLTISPSVAQIQGLFLKHKHVPEDNLLDVDTLVKVCKDNADLAVRHIYL